MAQPLRGVSYGELPTSQPLEKIRFYSNLARGSTCFGTISDLACLLKMARNHQRNHWGHCEFSPGKQACKCFNEFAVCFEAWSNWVKSYPKISRSRQNKGASKTHQYFHEMVWTSFQGPFTVSFRCAHLLKMSQLLSDSK